jgi:hypothetical protein
VHPNSSPEDGNRFSFRNVVFYITPEDGNPAIPNITHRCQSPFGKTINCNKAGVLRDVLTNILFGLFITEENMANLREGSDVL